MKTDLNERRGADHASPPVPRRDECDGGDFWSVEASRARSREFDEGGNPGNQAIDGERGQGSGGEVAGQEADAGVRR